MAVKLAQRDAHGEEKPEGVGAERRAAGGCGFNFGKAQPVTHGTEQQQIGEPRAAAFLQCFEAAIDGELEDPLIEFVGIHHAGAQIGGGLLPNPGRQEQVGWADLTHVMHGGLAALWKVDPDAAEQRHANHIDLLHDPWQGQHADIFVGGFARIELQIGCDMRQKRLELQHGELGIGGCARGRAQDRDILAAALRHLGFEQIGLGCQLAGREPLELAPRHQPRVVIFPHAAVIMIDDAFDVPGRLLKFKQLVDLLFILSDDKGGG